MEIAKDILAVLGAFGVVCLLVWWAACEVESFQSRQLKRQRVHDDLNDHTRKLKGLADSENLHWTEIKCLWDAVNKLKAEVDNLPLPVEAVVAGTTPAVEEIPEATTVSEVLAGEYRYFVDGDGGYWRFGNFEGNELLVNGEWNRRSMGFEEVVEVYGLEALTRQRIADLPK